MDKIPENKGIGVILVDNIPLETTDDQLNDFFKEIDDISSISYIMAGEGVGNLERSCWVHV